MDAITRRTSIPIINFVLDFIFHSPNDELGNGIIPVFCHTIAIIVGTSGCILHPFAVDRRMLYEGSQFTPEIATPIKPLL
jgi:hypothetical protein